MDLGLAKNEVRLLPYSTEWKEEFKRVKAEIITATGMDEKRIEHIGSTAIYNLTAKPVIDLLVGVDNIKNVDRTLFKEFQKVGFLRLRVERPAEIVFARFTDETYEVKTHFIHMVDFDKELWRDQLFFRNYLNSNEEAREEYRNIKTNSANQANIDINTYTDLKEPFVKKIFNRRTL